MHSVLRAASNAGGLLVASLVLPPCYNPVGAHPAETNIRAPVTSRAQATAARERTSINSAWRFQRFEENPDGLSYNDTLKPWILPQANDFIVDGSQHAYPTDSTAPGADVIYVQSSFDDSSWEQLNLPHDWAIKGPFLADGIGGGMGRLPSNGIGWYRRKLTFTEADVNSNKSIFLDIDGAQSHAAVWLNGNLVGGWPYGYASFRVDLTAHAKAGGDNLLAVRLENQKDSSRWYPGAGIYRNVWIVKTSKVHVAQSGTKIRTPSVSADSATVNLVVEVENKLDDAQTVDVATEVHLLGSDEVVATFAKTSVDVAAQAKASVNGSVTITNPQLWGVLPSGTPNQYIAVTTVSSGDSVLDTYESKFGVRSLEYTSNGLLVNGERVYVQGTNNHHDLGSIGAAFNHRAAQRQLEYLRELGSNALRMSHNPPAPELLDLADEFGFLVFNEAFDVWNNAKVDNDYHLLFPDWHEPDLRSFIRRDINHPSVMVWSIGNEIPEQFSAAGGPTGQVLKNIVYSEDGTRPITSALNGAQPGSALADVLDVESLNYQGEGDGDSYDGSFPRFHATYPDKLLWTSESASALSSRETYIFPVVGNQSAIVVDGSGGNSSAQHVSAYELYGPSWGSSADKVFAQQDRYQPFAGGEFVWTGWDYIGEPTPYDGGQFTARSSYFGIIDLAGFKKDRWWLYQSRWAPEVRSAHILPHWNWAGQRDGMVTPVHVFSSADEAELFVNGKSAGRIAKGKSEYRFRWDNVTYSPGSLRAVTYKGGKVWAEEEVRTVGAAASLNITADRTAITGDGYDLSYVSIAVVDANGDRVPDAANEITFSVEGSGEIVSTDNGDPTDLTVFPSRVRKAFNGYALAIVKASGAGKITVKASADGLTGAEVTVTAS
ncbi:hypothetical protein diail_8698 [Diaporthe ilicicola]|nr:hypothetical protein diail_8698 [Diaporthe ilicicola]